jgi:hypothetical protein
MVTSKRLARSAPPSEAGHMYQPFGLFIPRKTPPDQPCSFAAREIAEKLISRINLRKGLEGKNIYIRTKIDNIIYDVILSVFFLLKLAFNHIYLQGGPLYARNEDQDAITPLHVGVRLYRGGGDLSEHSLVGYG